MAKPCNQRNLGAENNLGGVRRAPSVATIRDVPERAPTTPVFVTLAGLVPGEQGSGRPISSSVGSRLSPNDVFQEFLRSECRRPYHQSTGLPVRTWPLQLTYPSPAGSMRTPCRLLSVRTRSPAPGACPAAAGPSHLVENEFGGVPALACPVLPRAGSRLPSSQRRNGVFARFMMLYSPRQSVVAGCSNVVHRSYTAAEIPGWHEFRFTRGRLLPIFRGIVHQSKWLIRFRSYPRSHRARFPGWESSPP